MSEARKKWDDEHTTNVSMSWVSHEGTEATGRYLRPARPIRVCKTCRSSERICRCAWRDE